MPAQNSENAIREQSCPISLDLLAQLIRTDGEVREELILNIPGDNRAALSFFCYSRVHLRSLAFDIILQCEMKDLRQYAGAKGDLLRQQALDFKKESESRNRGKRGITLARRAVA